MRGVAHSAPESRNILAIDDKFEGDMDGLIEAGKEKGYLTYREVNDTLPDEIGSARRSRRPDDHHQSDSEACGAQRDLVRPFFACFS